MKYALCIETIFSGRPFVECVELTKRAGYNTVELWHVEGDRLPVLRHEALNGFEVAMLIGASQLVTRDRNEIAAKLEGLKRNLDIALELNCPNLCLFVGNRDDNALFSTQRNAIIDFLGSAADILTGSGVKGIVESVSPKGHESCFLISMHDAASIVKAVDRPEIKLQFDIFHTAITDDDVESLIDRHFDDIAYFQAADAPGRGQPGTGELNYSRILRNLERRGFEGYLSWEFLPQGDALEAVAAARAVEGLSLVGVS